VQLCPPFGLALLNHLLAEQRHQVGVVGVPLVDPGTGDGGELGGVSGLGDLGEPGRLQQLPVWAGGRHGDRAVAGRQAAVKGGRRPLATTAAARAVSASLSARAAADRNPSIGTSARTTWQPVLAAR